MPRRPNGAVDPSAAGVPTAPTQISLTDPDSLRAALDRRKGQRGGTALRSLLDRHAFRLKECELERRFLRIARKAGLPLPRRRSARVEGTLAELVARRVSASASA